jgi:hypothetical protein
LAKKEPCVKLLAEKKEKRKYSGTTFFLEIIFLTMFSSRNVFSPNFLSCKIWQNCSKNLAKLVEFILKKFQFFGGKIVRKKALV